VAGPVPVAAAGPVSRSRSRRPRRRPAGRKPARFRPEGSPKPCGIRETRPRLGRLVPSARPRGL